MFNLLYRKFIQDYVHQILSESTGFCGRYDKRHFGVCFFGSQCRYEAGPVLDTNVRPGVELGCHFHQVCCTEAREVLGQQRHVPSPLWLREGNAPPTLAVVIFPCVLPFLAFSVFSFFPFSIRCILQPLQLCKCFVAFSVLCISVPCKNDAFFFSLQFPFLAFSTPLQLGIARAQLWTILPNHTWQWYGRESNPQFSYFLQPFHHITPHDWKHTHTSVNLLYTSSASRPSTKTSYSTASFSHRLVSQSKAEVNWRWRSQWSVTASGSVTADCSTPRTTDHFILTVSHLHRRRKCFITDKCACSLTAWRHCRKQRHTAVSMSLLSINTAVSAANIVCLWF